MARKLHSKRKEIVALRFFDKQDVFFNAVLSGDYRFLMYGGAIRGGKSIVACSLVIILARMFPGSRWAIVRKDLPTLRRNTLPTFESIRPPDFVREINKSTWAARCSNGSEILFFPESIKDDPDLDRWKGLEVNGFVFDEANELSEKSFNKAIERAGSWKIKNGDQPDPLILLTCNPSKNWVKRLFHDPWQAGGLKPPYYYLPAKIEDNPHLPPEYVKNLENLKTTDPAGYARFVLGDWNAADDPDQLIQLAWILAAKEVEPAEGPKKLGVDVARFGDDATVFLHVEGNAIAGIDYYKQISIDRTASIAQAKINEGPINADNVLVDTVGLGAGVADILKREGFDVTEVVSGGSAPDDPDSFYKFKNVRSWLWWNARELLRSGQVSIAVDDSRLVEDLTAPRYSVSGDKVLTVEPKDQIKRRIGRSTDAGDAFVYALADPAKLSGKKPVYFSVG